MQWLMTPTHFLSKKSLLYSVETVFASIIEVDYAGLGKKMADYYTITITYSQLTNNTVVYVDALKKNEP